MRNILVLLLFQLLVSKTYACSCAFGEGDLEDLVKGEFESASSVVLAKVESIKKLEQFQYGQMEESEKNRIFHYRHKTHFSEIKSWKGKHGKQFYTDIVVACCMCGYEFEVGKTYLLYLYGPDEEGYYSTSSCSRTSHFSNELNPELEVLDKLLE